MRVPDWLRVTAPRLCRKLPDGRMLRLLTTQEVLEARREALELAETEGRETALCSNACLVAQAVVRGRRPVYRNGAAVLAQCTEAEIQDLARQWAEFDRAENPGLGAERDRVDQLKKTLERMPRQRLRWRVLKEFGALPTEKRVKAMSGRDYLWCVVNLLLDEEETAACLCPVCRAEAERVRCPVCGRETGEMIREENPAFDWARYETLKEGRQL